MIYSKTDNFAIYTAKHPFKNTVRPPLRILYLVGEILGEVIEGPSRGGGLVQLRGLQQIFAIYSEKEKE